MDRFFRYLRAAFFVQEKVPLLGSLPVNLMAIAAFVALGFGHPAFWLVGLIGEVAFLWALVGSARFRKLVDGKEILLRSQNRKDQEKSLLEDLPPDQKQRYHHLQAQWEKIRDNRKKRSEEGIVVPDDLDSYADLLNVYLRQLNAQGQLASSRCEEESEKIRQRIETLDSELAEPRSLSKSARNSKELTIDILKKRLRVFERRDQSLQEIASDLEQIEAQFQLAVDSSEVGSSMEETKLDLEFARSMIRSPNYLAFSDDPLEEVAQSEPLLES